MDFVKKYDFCKKLLFSSEKNLIFSTQLFGQYFKFLTHSANLILQKVFVIWFVIFSQICERIAIKTCFLLKFLKMTHTAAPSSGHFSGCRPTIFLKICFQNKGSVSQLLIWTSMLSSAESLKPLFSPPWMPQDAFLGPLFNTCFHKIPFFTKIFYTND